LFVRVDFLLPHNQQVLSQCFFDKMFIFAEGMDSNEAEQSCGRTSSDHSLISLITAGNEEGCEKGKGQLLALLLLDEEEVTLVEEELQSHGEMRLNPGHMVDDSKPEAQERTQAPEDAEQMTPEVLEAIETLRSKLGALGYGLPDLNSLIDTLRKMGKNPARILRIIGKKLPSEVGETKNRKTAQPEKPLSPVRGCEELWRYEDEEQDAVELYWADKFREAKRHHMATETVSFLATRKKYSLFTPKNNSCLINFDTQNFL